MSVLSEEEVRALREKLYTPGWFERHEAERAMLDLLDSHEALRAERDEAFLATVKFTRDRAVALARADMLEAERDHLDRIVAEYHALETSAVLGKMRASLTAALLVVEKARALVKRWPCCISGNESRTDCVCHNCEVRRALQEYDARGTK